MECMARNATKLFRYKKSSGKGKSYETTFENIFLSSRPRAFPPPGVRFSAETTENRNYNKVCPIGSPVKSSTTTGLGHQHGRRFIVLEDQYGHRNIM